MVGFPLDWSFYVENYLVCLCLKFKGMILRRDCKIIKDFIKEKHLVKKNFKNIYLIFSNNSLEQKKDFYLEFVCGKYVVKYCHV